MLADSATHYEILGVSSTASAEAIRAAYREQLLSFRQQAGSVDAPSPDLLDRVRIAFEILTDPDKRAQYDRELAAGERPFVATAEVHAANANSPEATGPHRFEFVGEGAAYFRIWIVNLCLSIVTLGIYSAWAKVRREQYFHRNLRLDGSGFEYHGKPMAILKGRLVALGLLFVISLLQKAGPLYNLLAMAIFALALPWFLIRAMRFRAINTSYRGLRFSFAATYGQAFKVFVGNGLLSILTLGLWLPRLVRDARKFIVDHASFGTTPFECELRVGEVYRIFLLPILCMLGLGILAALIGKSPLLIIFGLIFIVLYLSLPAYIAVKLSNALWSASHLGRHGFRSEIPVGRYVFVSLSNWLGIIFTLGLFIPWAKVRLARLRAEHLELLAAGTIEDFVAHEREQVSAIGEGASDLFDMDLAL